MLDIGWTELLVIAIVLIVVVGPKDLPPMIRAFGKFTANLRRMAGDFRAQFDEALREADMDDVRKTIADAQSLNPANSLRDALNPLRQMGEDIKSDLRKVTTPPVTSLEMTPPAAVETPAAVAAPVEPLVATVSEPVAVKPKVARKPRAAAVKATVGVEEPAPKPRNTAARAKPAVEAASAPVKKTATRRKKTTETGKDDA